MLPQIKNDLLYLLNILESIEKIYLYVGTITDAENFYYANDQLNFNATLNLFANLGENAGKISEELKIETSHMKWQDIKDFRNKVVHDYTGIDLFIVFRIIKNELLPLKNGIIKIISSELKNRHFDVKEFREAQKSFYYRHVPFDKIEY